MAKFISEHRLVRWPYFHIRHSVTLVPTCKTCSHIAECYLNYLQNVLCWQSYDSTRLNHRSLSQRFSVITKGLLCLVQKEYQCFYPLKVELFVLIESSKELLSQGVFCPKMLWHEYRKVKVCLCVDSLIGDQQIYLVWPMVWLCIFDLK